MIKELKEMSLNLKDPVTEQCEELWHMYQPIVLKLCEYKLQSAPTLIEDCVQEVFADLLAYLRTGNKIGNPRRMAYQGGKQQDQGYLYLREQAQAHDGVF